MEALSLDLDLILMKYLEMLTSFAEEPLLLCSWVLQVCGKQPRNRLSSQPTFLAH